MGVARIGVATRQPYDVLIGDGLVSQVGSLVERVAPAHRYAIITDSNVQPLHGSSLSASFEDAGQIPLFSFDAGEANKTRATWSRLSDELIEAGFGRDCTIVALGGGVVGDVAGFVAATLMRGVPFVQVPTTLLGMIDSSIGGKTGVDTAHGKNLVGAFHQPAVVVCDPELLDTLPAAEFRNGLAEALKHGAIADAEYFDQVSSSGPHVRGPERIGLIERSVEVKASVVAGDEMEAGKRAILNFGHTVGHAIERATDFSLPHGDAVAIGMVLEARVGTELRVTSRDCPDRIEAALQAVGLPSSLPDTVRGDEVISLMGSDKKMRGGRVRSSLLKHIGEAARDPSGNWTYEVPTEALRGVLN